MDYLYRFKDGLTIVKDDMPLDDHCMHYSDDWESLLSFKVPGKMRKTKQLLNYNESMNILHKISYGVLSFFDEIPYSIPLDHVSMNGKLYFHSSKSVPGMALIQSETVRPQVFTAKCSEPQAIAVK